MPAKSSGSSSADGTEEDLARATQSERRRPENGAAAAERQAWQGSAWRPRRAVWVPSPRGRPLESDRGTARSHFRVRWT